MNIADILERVVDGLNENGNCDFCWRFVFGGRQDYMNLAKVEQNGKCCAIVGVLRINDENGYRRNDNFTTKIYKDWKLQLFAGVPSSLGKQFYNEVDEDETCTSKWSEYIHPIGCCVDTMDVCLCDVHNCHGSETTIEIINWTSEMKMNFLDGNYDGWIINTTIREWHSFN